MTLRNLFYSILLLTALSISFSFGQTEKYNEDWRWVDFTTESGLPSNTVTNLIETPDGTVWAATSAGLAWYDNFRWHAITDSALTGKAPTWLAPDKNDSVLVVVDKRLYIGSSRGFRPLRIYLDGTEKLVECACRADSNRLIIAAECALFDDRFHRIDTLTFANGEYKKPLFYTKSRRIWFHGRKDLFLWENNQFRKYLQFPAKSLVISDLVESSGASPLLSVFNPPEVAGLWEWDKAKKTFIRLREGLSRVRSMDLSDQGEAMIVYETGDIGIRSRHQRSLLNPVPPQLKNVLFIKFRNNGDLWAGTERGLFLCKTSSERWTYWTHPFSNMMKDMVHEILQTHDGSIWAATVEGLEIHKPGGKVQVIDQVDGKKIYTVTGLCEDDQNNIWISSGSEFTGAYRWDGRSWRHFGKKEGLDARNVHKIRKDRQGRLWFLGMGNVESPEQPGVFEYSNGTFTLWGKDEGVPPGRAYAFGQSRSGEVWFGTSEGWSRWFEGRWSRWFSKQIFTLALDSSNGLWFADRNSGLGRLHGDGSIQYFTTKDGLISNNIWEIRFDQKGILWMSTLHGISCYTQGSFTNFDLTTGLKSLSSWPILPTEDKIYIGTQGSGVNILSRKEEHDPTPHVEILKPITESDTTLLRWNPFSFWNEVKRENINTRYRLDSEPWSPWNTGREVKFPGLRPGNHVFRVQAKGLFGNYDSLGQRIDFAISYPFYETITFVLPISLLSCALFYLLVNAYVRKRRHEQAIRESESRLRTVTETTTSAIFIFHNCSPMLYVNSSAETLTGYERAQLLKMRFSDLLHPSCAETLCLPGVVPDQPASAPFHDELKIVTKTGAEKWIDATIGQISFQNASAILCTAIDITTRKSAEEKLLSYHAMLQSLTEELAGTEERERRRMATYLHDSIGQALALSRLKLGSMKRKISASDLDDVRRYIDQASKQIQSLTFELSPPVLYELSFEDALEWLTEQFDTDYHLPVWFFHEQHSLDIDHNLRVLLFHAVRELLHNVVKHAEALSAKVTLRAADGSLSIIVQDDGKGFDMSTLTHQKNHKGGFGLFNIRERLHRLNGGMTVDSHPGRGTTITLLVPLQAKENNDAH